MNRKGTNIINSGNIQAGGQKKKEWLQDNNKHPEPAIMNDRQNCKEAQPYLPPDNMIW
ncbi:MAG: hypothetical protein H6541_13280 [Lentimicrobiaceae bacterium]|nr:hypothetical protein [Lentimicrobiaceae bacterium]MCB9024360.1 hypothetical protein [Lentimicrobiaceae bacterium]MCO5264675.1 hypothetical protein [Lentimicrobium sp.]HPG33375.1 hypothetical protein [Lentimicrobium sp.]